MLGRARRTSRPRGRTWVQLSLCILIVSSNAAARAQATDRVNAKTSSALSSRNWAIELSPLELLRARASINFEVALAAHDAIILTSVAQPRSADIGAGVWAELGYRVYAGDGGLQGFFIDPSLGAGIFTYFTDQAAGEQDARSFNIACRLRLPVRLAIGPDARLWTWRTIPACVARLSGSQRPNQSVRTRIGCTGESTIFCGARAVTSWKLNPQTTRMSNRRIADAPRSRFCGLVGPNALTYRRQAIG